MPTEPSSTDQEHLDVLGATMTITMEGSDTDGEFTVVDMLAPPGLETGLHTNKPAEVTHVLEGEMIHYVDGESSHLTPGMTGYVAGGHQHGFRVEGDETLRALVFFAPAGIEEFFRAVGEPMADRTLPAPHEVTETDLEELFSVGEEHGFEFYGPLPIDD